MSFRNVAYMAVVAMLAIALTGCPPDTAEPPPDDEHVDAQRVDEFTSDMEGRLSDARSDIDRIEGRADQHDEDGAENIRDTVEDLRSDALDLQERLVQPDTASVSQWRSWRRSIQSDMASLEGRIDRAIAESTTDLASLESDARERLADIRSRIQQVPDPDRRSSLEESANEVEQEINELAEADADDLESHRSDIGSSLESLRNDVGDEDLYQRHNDRDRDTMARDDY